MKRISVFVIVVVAVLFLTIIYFGFTKQKAESPKPEVFSTPIPIPTKVYEVSGKDETQILKTEIKKFLVEKHGAAAEKLNITVAKVEGNYAKGGASEVGMGGGMWFAAKVDGNWELVWDGNGIITCDSLVDVPDFPASMIPECFDEKKEELIVR